MREAYVRLVCPECQKDWESTPGNLPTPDEQFSCPDCTERRRLAEFMRTERDLETLQDLQ